MNKIKSARDSSDIITSIKELMFSFCSFVCLSVF